MYSKNRSIKPTITLALIAIPACNANDANNARLRELETTIQCSGGGGGCSGYDYTRRLFVCPSYGQN